MIIVVQDKWTFWLSLGGVVLMRRGLFGAMTRKVP